MGDRPENFTIQSISKVFVYGMALEDCGREALLEKVGVEPTVTQYYCHYCQRKNLVLSESVLALAQPNLD